MSKRGKLMDNSNIFNQYFYEVLDDMEDLARDSYSEPEDEQEEEVLNFCRRMKEAISQMDQNEAFYFSFVKYISDLSSTEKSILFNFIAVPFYEIWKDFLLNVDEPQEKRVSSFATCLAAEHIVRIMDDKFGYSYFKNMEKEAD